MIPDFHRDPYEGQMMPFERKILFDAVIEMKPDIVFEVGTWNGGGSTLFLSSGLHENGKGLLYTVESDRGFYDHAVNLYKKDFQHLLPFVKFHFGNSLNVYKEVLKTIDKIDLLVLDGAENSLQTVAEFDMFYKYMQPGSVMICHDWYTEKMMALSREIKNDLHWQCIDVKNGPTGMAIFQYV